MGRIVVAASPLSGHVTPMLQIGAHLQSGGHDVVVISAPEYSHDVRRAGLRLEELDDGAQIQRPSPLPPIPMPKLLRQFLFGLKEMQSTFVAPLRAQYETLDRILDQAPVDVVLADLTFTGVLPVLLVPQRPPVFIVGVGPLTLSSADTPPFGMAWQPKPGVDYAPMTRVVHNVLLKGIQNKLNAALADLGSGPMPVHLTDWPRMADRLLQLTVPAFEYPHRDLPATVDFVGPVLPDTDDTFEPPEWWDEVVGASTVIHVTQGTFDNHDHDQLIGPTLDALSDTDAVVVATTGHSRDNHTPVRRSRNTFVTDWLPYSALLPHVDVMITNGGYGGVQHALRYGIPLIVAGETSDKAEVAARVAYSGAGIDLRTAAPTSAQIRNAIRAILATPTYREAATRLGQDIAQTDALGSLDRLVDATVRRRQSAPRSP